jgi:hypothetical protein
VVKHSHFFEQEQLLTQFVAAFDDIFIMRYDKNRVGKEKINVRYVLGPKQRVLYDIVNQSKNMTLPVIAMEQKNIRRDPQRIANKDQHMYRPHVSSKNLSKIPQPIPVICDLDVSIVCSYKSDLDQIISNIIPWCNPYFIISWKVPDEFGMDFDDEIRSEVTWSGSVDFENPIDIGAQDKYRIVGNTSFTIKGWIFPSLKTPVAPIYVVRSDLHAVGSGVDLYSFDSYSSLSGVDVNTTDVVLISAYPEFTNCFINGKPYNELSLYSIDKQTFTFYGKRFDFDNTWYLSANQVINGLAYEEIETVKYPTISAYRIPDVFVTKVNDNIVSISLSSGYVNLSSGNYTFITRNNVGWGMSCGLLIDNYNLAYNQFEIIYNSENFIYSW